VCDIGYQVSGLLGESDGYEDQGGGGCAVGSQVSENLGKSECCEGRGLVVVALGTG
jgi:hypothetical protein